MELLSLIYEIRDSYNIIKKGEVQDFSFFYDDLLSKVTPDLIVELYDTQPTQQFRCVVLTLQARSP